jgi:hypothetical protein
MDIVYVLVSHISELVDGEWVESGDVVTDVFQTREAMEEFESHVVSRTTQSVSPVVT